MNLKTREKDDSVRGSILFYQSIQSLTHFVAKTFKKILRIETME